MAQLPLNLLINAILAHEGLRNMMVQPVDYGETSQHDPVTKSYLTKISSLFPDLKFSEHYQGIIVSREAFADKTMNSHELGKVLGYPCYMDFEQDGEVVFNVHARSKKGTNVLLFANVACDASKQPLFEDFVKNANNIINKNYVETFSELLDHNCIFLRNFNSFSSKTLIERLLNKTFDASCIASLQNILTNLFFMTFDISCVEFDNPIHVGMLLGLLSTDVHNPVECFYPLYHYPNEQHSAEHSMKSWGKLVLKTFCRSKLNR